MTSWHGHRNDPDIPPAVQHVWREKFHPRQGAGAGMQSNVDLAVLNSAGKVVHWFDGFHRQDFGPRETLAQYTARELRRAVARLRPVAAPVKEHPLILPDLNQSRGIRIFVRLKDNLMKAYQAPIVEIVPLEPDDWKPLVWPEQERFVDAARLKKWLSQVYPPGVMERTNPRTKLVYGIKAVEGTLSLAPAGSDGQRRYAVASGNIRLTDEGEDEFSYEGQLEIVLTYELRDPNVRSLRGVFEGIYPRYDRQHRRTRRIPLQAVFESRPE